MVVVQVYSENIKIKYKSTLLSKATIFSIICIVILLIVPYLIALKTEGFWDAENSFYEQPKVSMTGEYLFMALTTNHSHPIICSTFAFYKEHVDHLDKCALFRLRETDNNFDGKHDQLDFSININIANLYLTSLIIILPVNYELKTICPFTMKSAIIFQQDFHHKGIHSFVLIGDLSLHQTSALHCDEDYYNFNDPIIGGGTDDTQFEFADIIQNYSSRNLTTHLSNVYTYFKTGNNNIFNIKLSVRYPHHRIYYIPGFWHKMKMAWIQYLSIFVLLSWLLDKIKQYMYHKRWLLFYEESPIKKKI